MTYSHDHSIQSYRANTISIAVVYSPMTQVKLSGYVKDELDRIKELEDHTTYDSVVRSLINAYDIDDE